MGLWSGGEVVSFVGVEGGKGVVNFGGDERGRGGSVREGGGG